MKVMIKGKVIPSSNNYHLWKKSKTISIDLKAKRAKVEGYGSDNNIPFVWIGYDKNTLYIDNKYKNEITELSFKEFKGWTIMCVELSKYTLTITFVNIKEEIKC
jgi:hypothetical protein